eukprot:2040142-Lingulodinium_polyedra.AAC.1
MGEVWLVFGGAEVPPEASIVDSASDCFAANASEPAPIQSCAQCNRRGEGDNDLVAGADEDA